MLLYGVLKVMEIYIDIIEASIGPILVDVKEYKRYKEIL